MLQAGGVDALHDHQQAVVDLFGGPVQAHGVLAHLQARGGHATSVAGLARCIQHACRFECFCSLDGRRHVGTFGYAQHTVLDEGSGVVGVQLVLRGTGQGDVHRHVPGRFACFKLHPGALGVVVHTAVKVVLHIHQDGELFGGEAVFIDDGAARIRHRDHLGAQGHGLLDGVLGHIARARHRDAHAIERLTAGLEHFVSEVHRAVARGFRADQRAAKRKALAGEHAIGAVAELLVHARNESHLAPTHADVARRHVGVGAHMAEQLAGKGLAEAHDFAGALALGVKVRAALAAAHGQRGQCVLEGLLKRQELEHREVDRGVKAQAALVGANGHAVLDAVAAVDLHGSVVVCP